MSSTYEASKPVSRRCSEIPQFQSYLARVLVGHQLSRVMSLAAAHRCTSPCGSDIGFLENVLRHPEFLSGTATTSFIERNPQLISGLAGQQSIPDSSKVLTYLGELVRLHHSIPLPVHTRWHCCRFKHWGGAGGLSARGFLPNLAMTTHSSGSNRLSTGCSSARGRAPNPEACHPCLRWRRW